MSLFGQDSYYYWYKGENIPLELKTNKKFVLYENEYADSAVSFLKEKSWQIIKKDKSNVVNTLTPYRKGKGSKEYNWSIIGKNEGGNTDLSSSELPDYMLYVSPAIAQFHRVRG